MQWWYVEEVCSELTHRMEVTCTQITSTTLKDELIGACKPGDLFSGLKTRYLREQYYRERFNYVVKKTTDNGPYRHNNHFYQEPSPVLLGSDWEWIVSRGKRELKICATVWLLARLKVQTIVH